MKSLTRYLPVAIAMAMAGGLSVLAATVAVEKIEVRARADISRELLTSGQDWVSLDVDGLQVALSGTAPDEASRFAALTAAGKVVDATRILDRTGVRPSQEIEAPEFSVEILRNLDGVSLIGLIPAASDRDAIIERIGNFSEAPVADLLEVGDYPEPSAWAAAMEFALDALDRLPRSKVSVTAERVAVTGIVDSEQMRRQVENELGRDVPSGVRLVLDISAPRPVVAPFTTRFLIDDKGARFDACVADTTEARRTIFDAAGRAGFTSTQACQIGLGAPSLDWGQAVAMGIEALGRLGSGSVTYSDADISLVVPHTVTVRAFDREIGELDRVLPEGFSLTAVRTPAPKVEGDDAEEAKETPEFIATLSVEEGVQLRGRLPSERIRTVVESYAHAHFGRDATYAATRLDPDLPEGWALKVLAALDALSHLHNGSVTVRPDALEIAGETGREDASASIAGLLSERLEDGASYDIKVSYIETLDPLAGLPTPEECVKQLNTVLAIQKITFEPGSASIDTAGLSIIDQLAEILRDCQTVQMEIGGHTDSQGRESMNENLSQERANAVLNGIMARRVLTSNLTAEGYGEALPIADNDTEEGRETNRRIEFKLIVAEDAETAAVDDPEGEDTDENAGDTDPDAEAGSNEQN